MALRGWLITILVIFVTANANAVTLKIATLSPEGSNWMQKFRTSAKEIKERTNSRVKMKYYPGGVMGDDSAVLKKIRIRQLHGGAMTGGSLARFYPDSQIYSVPLRFENLEQVDYVRELFDPELVEGFEKGGFVTFGVSGGGFAYIMSKQPVRRPEDLKNYKVWSPSTDPATTASFQAFEVSPIPLPIGDVLAGLQTGLIDTIATSPVGAVSLQWHTQINYVTEVPLIYLFAVLAIEKKAFNKLTVDDQQIVREVMTKVFSDIDLENRSDNQKALEALANQGINIIKPSASELEAWQNKGRLAAGNLVRQGAISSEMMNRLESRLEKFDSANSAEE